MGYIPPPGGTGTGAYSLRLHHANVSTVTDSATYYFGGTNLAWTTSANHSRVYIPKAGTIKAITYYQYCTHGTSETLAYYIRINNTTDYTIDAAFPIDADDTVVTNYSLNISVNAGDYLEIKVVCPAWATNPTGILGGGHIYIETS